MKSPARIDLQLQPIAAVAVILDLLESPLFFSNLPAIFGKPA